MAVDTDFAGKFQQREDERQRRFSDEELLLKPSPSWYSKTYGSKN